MVRTDFGPYDGPLAERLIREPMPEFAFSFEIVVDTPELAGFAHWLSRNPIYVLAPGHRYVGWGIRTFADEPGEICVLGFNTLLTPHEQPLGPHWGDGGRMLAWAFAVLDHYELPYDPMTQYYARTREQLIAWYSGDSEPIDWPYIAKRLRSNGRAVPADLFEQPTR